jgi:hypothetical protein
MARLMKFYPGLGITDHDALPHYRREILIELMERAQESDARS